MQFDLPAAIANQGVYLAISGKNAASQGVFLNGTTNLCCGRLRHDVTVANGGLIPLSTPSMTNQNPVVGVDFLPSDYLDAGQAILFVGGKNPGVDSDLLTVNGSGLVPTPTVTSNPNDVYQLFELTNASSNAIIAASPSGATESGNTVTITGNNTFGTGQTVQISGVAVAGYNGTFTITSANPSSFQYTNPTSGLAASGGGTASVAGLDVDLSAIDQLGVTSSITSTPLASAPYPLSQTGAPVTTADLYFQFATYFAGSQYLESLLLGQNSSGTQFAAGGAADHPWPSGKERAYGVATSLKADAGSKLEAAIIASRPRRGPRSRGPRSPSRTPGLPTR